jgi:acylphosphatase
MGLLTAADELSALPGPERLEAVVRGRVQGVGFRAFIVRRARQLGVAGWVANESSGRVRWVAEGPRDRLGALLEASRCGPPGGWVDGVDETWSPASGEFHGFEIRSGWHGGD